MKPILGTFKMKIQEFIGEIGAIFKAYDYIAAAYLFGSQIRGTDNPMSDLDIAILLKENAPSTILRLKEKLLLEYKIQSHFGLNQVDLVELNLQGVVFQHNVLKTGKLIYDGDPIFRKKFETKVILEYCDFKPTLRLIEKYHLQGRLRRCGIT